MAFMKKLDTGNTLRAWSFDGAGMCIGLKDKNSPISNALVMVKSEGDKKQKVVIYKKFAEQNGFEIEMKGESFAEERKDFACMIAFYVGTIDASLDYINVMNECVEIADKYIFPMETDDPEYIDTERAFEDARDYAEKIVEERRSGRYDSKTINQ